MQTIELVVTDKMLLFKDDSPHAYLVSHNDDYVMHIELEEQRNAMFAVFVRNKQAVRCAIDNEGYVLNSDNERKVPEWALSAPVMTVGVVSDGYATTPLSYSVRGSIKQMYGEEIIQPDDPLVEQLIALVNGLSTMPAVTEDDNGKVAKVIDGTWQAAEESGGGINFTTDETLTLDENNVLKVNTTNSAEEDNTLPITSAGVYTQVGNINALLQTI